MDFLAVGTPLLYVRDTESRGRNQLRYIQPSVSIDYPQDGYRNSAAWQMVAEQRTTSTHWKELNKTQPAVKWVYLSASRIALCRLLAREGSFEAHPLGLSVRQDNPACLCDNEHQRWRQHAFDLSSTRVNGDPEGDNRCRNIRDPRDGPQSVHLPFSAGGSIPIFIFWASARC